MIDDDCSNSETMISADFDSLFKIIKTQEDIYQHLNETIAKIINNRS